MKTKHTPGPWEVPIGLNVYSETDTHGMAIATCHCDPNYRSKEESEANARLIAAAPELLSGLKDAVEILFNIGLPGGVDAKTLNRLASVIEKAEGNE